MSYQRDVEQSGGGESRISNTSNSNRKGNPFKMLNISLQNKCISQFLKISVNVRSVHYHFMHSQRSIFAAK